LELAMSDPIYLIGADEQLIRVDRVGFALESDLQRLIDRHPELIPGGAVDASNPRRWLVIRSEAGIPNEEGGSQWWSIDHLLVDQDGVPTFVEVKRSSDTRIRREVVAQMLEYAANATAYWQVGTLRTWFEEAKDPDGRTSDEVLGEFLGGGQLDAATFWDRVGENLQAARVRCVFVADEIPATLRRLVEFMNEHLDTVEVLAIELPQYVSAGEHPLKALVPRLVGQTAKAQALKSGGGPRQTKRWDEETFMAEVLERHGLEARTISVTILEWLRQHADRVDWGSGAQQGSMIGVVASPGTRVGRVFVTVWTTGYVEVAFQYLMADPLFADVPPREALRQRLNSITGIAMGPDVISRRPSVPFAVLQQPLALSEFLDVFEDVVAALRGTATNVFAPTADTQG
ncbi:MAG: hypothetical protein WAL84_11525, partial [Candidatus Dormiibacterota bacterium]